MMIIEEDIWYWDGHQLLKIETLLKTFFVKLTLILQCYGLSRIHLNFKGQVLDCYLLEEEMKNYSLKLYQIWSIYCFFQNKNWIANL